MWHSLEILKRSNTCRFATSILPHSVVAATRPCIASTLILIKLHSEMDSRFDISNWLNVPRVLESPWVFSLTALQCSESRWRQRPKGSARRPSPSTLRQGGWQELRKCGLADNDVNNGAVVLLNLLDKQRLALLVRIIQHLVVTCVALVALFVDSLNALIPL
jgi:hypothetical protein